MSSRPSFDADRAPRQLPAAGRVYKISIERWGAENPVHIVGSSPAMQKMMARVEKLARFREPVLIRGESGVGKECVAQALYLLGSKPDDPFVVVNCPQYRTSDTTVSELFGHAKGSFTGAHEDHKGLFERAQRGLIFLDEIADLPMSAQTMLLRTLASGEVRPLGAEKSRRIDVRTLAATNRSLNELAADDEAFRRDLLWRLQYFRIDVPPLRERGEDWLLLIEHALESLARRYGERKRFSTDALRLLESYAWPGNVRELLALTTASFALADSDRIDVCDLPRPDIAAPAPESQEEELLRRLEAGEGNFWTEIQQPYLDRELNRSQVRELISRGLRSAGAYLRLLERWGGAKEDYQRFMDFLRHHRLKPGDSSKP